LVQVLIFLLILLQNTVADDDERNFL